LGKQFIFQLDDVNNDLLGLAQANSVNAVPLFDLSGGNGILPEHWPKATKYGFCGYAGGLSPENLEEQLAIIDQCTDGPVWVDAESMVRSNGDQQFDLEKVERFLQIAEKWVHPPHKS
jgi:phosphoribosylanthranilate isomerase